MFSRAEGNLSLMELGCDGGGWAFCHQVIYTDWEFFREEIH